MGKIFWLDALAGLIVIGIMLLLFLWSSVKGRLGLKEDFPLSWSFKKNYIHYVMLTDNQVGFWQLVVQDLHRINLVLPIWPLSCYFVR